MLGLDGLLAAPGRQLGGFLKRFLGLFREFVQSH
jgi:hypothetical protein